MGSMIRTTLALLGAITLTSCAAVRSTPYDVTASAVGNGLHYSMPRGLLRIQLISRGRGGDLYLDVSEPFIVGDPNATYLLESSSGLFANQEYRFVVDPQTRLLTYVNSSSEGQAGQILQRLVQSAAYVGGAPSVRGGDDGDRLIYSRIIDPFREAGCDFGATCEFDDIRHDLARAAGLPSNSEFFGLTLTPLFTVTAPSTGRGSPRECRRSICYRAPLPYILSVRVGSTDLSENISLPNEAPVMSTSIPAGLFATSRARVDLYQGMPARYVVDRDSELLAIAIVPFNVVNAGFSALSNVIQLRINYRNALETERRGQTPPTPAPPPSETDYNYGDDAQRTPDPTTDAVTTGSPWADNITAPVTITGSANSANVLFSIPLSGAGAAVSAPAVSQPPR